jgi:hypothetical protein
MPRFIIIIIKNKPQKREMSDLSAYRDKAANFGKLANQAEQDKDYAGAFEFYMKALDIFQHMIKCKFKLIRSYKRLLC